MTQGHHWQTLPWLNWRHRLGSQTKGRARSPLGRFTALSTPDASAQREQPLAAYLVGYPIPPIEELRAAFAPDPTPPLPFSAVTGEPTTRPFETAPTQDVSAAAIAPPSLPDSPSTPPPVDTILPPPLPTIQRQPLGRPTPLGSQVAAIAQAISNDFPGPPPPSSPRPENPARDRSALPEVDWPLPDATEQPWRDRLNAVPKLSPNRPTRAPHIPSVDELPSPSSPPEVNFPGTTSPAVEALLIDTPTLPDLNDADAIQPHSDPAPISPPAIAEPRSFPEVPGEDTATADNQPLTQPWTEDSGATDAGWEPAESSEPLAPETSIAAPGPGATDIAASPELAMPSPQSPLPEFPEVNSNTVDEAQPSVLASPESPTLENPPEVSPPEMLSPDIEARSQPSRPSPEVVASPSPDSSTRSGEPIPAHSNEASTDPDVPAIADPDSVDSAAIVPTNRAPVPPRSLPSTSTFPTPPSPPELSPNSFRNASPEGSPAPSARPPALPPTPRSRLGNLPPPPSPTESPQESATAPQVPLLPSIQRYVARTEERPRERLVADRPPTTPRAPLADLSDYVIPSMPRPTLPPAVPPPSPTPGQSTDEAAALPHPQRSTPIRVPSATHPPQPPSRSSTLPVQMRALESPVTDVWESPFDVAADFPDLDTADFSLDNLESAGLAAEPELATGESPEPATPGAPETTAASEAVTLTADIAGAEADAELLDHLAEWVYRDLRSHLRLRCEAQQGQLVALPPWWPPHPGSATQTGRSEQHLPGLPLPPKLHQLTTVVRQQVESRLRQDWERFPERWPALRF